MTQFPALTLYAQAAKQAVEHKALVQYLHSVGLIAAHYSEQTYLSGESFFEHLTFLGCAPNIALHPKEGVQFLRINIPQLKQPTLFANKNAKPPLCNHCAQPISDWRNLILTAEKESMLCPACNTSLVIAALAFRKRACYAKTVIQIAPVFESEAQPNPLFLNNLEQAFDVKFGYCFSHFNSLSE